jgi:hypothetical protein
VITNPAGEVKKGRMGGEQGRKRGSGQHKETCLPIRQIIGEGTGIEFRDHTAGLVHANDGEGLAGGALGTNAHQGQKHAGGCPQRCHFEFHSYFGLQGQKRGETGYTSLV